MERSHTERQGRLNLAMPLTKREVQVERSPYCEQQLMTLTAVTVLSGAGVGIRTGRQSGKRQDL